MMKGCVCILCWCEVSEGTLEKDRSESLETLEPSRH